MFGDEKSTKTFFALVDFLTGSGSYPIFAILAVLCCMYVLDNLMFRNPWELQTLPKTLHGEDTRRRIEVLTVNGSTIRDLAIRKQTFD